jgi:hypothetical protein
LGEDLATEGEAGPGGAEGRAASRRREAMEDIPFPESAMGEAAGPRLASREGGEEAAGSGGPSGGEATEGRVPSKGEGAGSEGGGHAATAQAATRGRGYSPSADTGIPSPLVDYRARFARAYAERTGKRIAASGPLSLKELGEIRRLFFRSFSLALGADSAEDPLDALLRRRWRELRGDIR